jgi:uncharacterized protein YjiS (DUF1127 family)
MYNVPAKPTANSTANASQPSTHLYSDREDLPQVLIGETWKLRCDAPTCAGMRLTAVLTLEVAPHRRRSWISRLTGSIVKLLAFLQREYGVRRGVAELSRMDDRTLYDIGIDRGAIEHAIRHGREFD